MLTRVFRCPHGELIIHIDAALCFYAIVKGMAAELPQSVINDTNSGADVEPRVEKCVNVCYGRSSMFSEPLRSRRLKPHVTPTFRIEIRFSRSRVENNRLFHDELSFVALAHLLGPIVGCHQPVPLD